MIQIPELVLAVLVSAGLGIITGTFLAALVA